MTATHDLIVVGGGLTGLAAAYETLAQGKARKQDWRIAVVEASARWGGKVLTEQTAGLTLEAGPDSFLAHRPAAIELCRELQLEPQLVGATPARTFIVSGGRLHPFPAGLRLAMPTRLGPWLTTPLLSPTAKLRAALDLVQRRAAPAVDETLAAFLTRHLGQEVTERLAEPLLAGIYAGRADRLSLLATWPQLAAMVRSHGSLIRAARAAAQTPPSAGPTFVTLKGGLSQWIRRLLQALAGVDLLSSSPLRGLYREGGGLYRLVLANGQKLYAPHVLLTTPAFVSARLLEPVSVKLAEQLGAIPYASTATIAFAYRNPGLARALSGHGFLVPRREGRLLTACTYVSGKWPHAAPPGTALIRCYVGRDGEDVLARTDADLIAAVQRELRELIGLTAQPDLTRLYRWPHAFPQYRVGHLDRLAHIRAALASSPGLELAGAAFEGLGLPDCVRQGREAVRRLLAVGQAAS